ncbi:LysM peptidoglycan-binding domain-containing protein [Phenylobacterium sp. LH3H17]|uniref:LysM peptidoglycan-binding domain-containing protein n=1 Tax=Phenylobacterium sp. LH3H17 TaxID=2903901 RepID=UPI0020C99280|nr:LysM peptidoglycan-binding domain-containing protein [Phenylobacterium sp. LH3H17]UTP38137.1 LysM peptidoglycan-binding domain-containing protein [Phenylobacterium sp. LH3H17]
MTLFLSRTALILLAGSALAACESLPQATQPNYPVRAAPLAVPPPAPAPAPAVVDQTPPARPTAPVESQNLPYIAPARELPAPPQPAPRPAAGGRLVETPGAAQTYTVKRGDNLAAIARTLGVSLQRLADENGLAPPYALRPGQVLQTPLTGATATAYVVAPGDTLYAIARRFGLTPQALADANSMGVNTSLAVGRRLILPETYRDRGATPAPAASTPGRRPTPARVETPAPTPERETVTVRRVTGKVVEVSGPPVSYTVKKGDNLDAIARELKTDRKQLADDNKLKAPYALQPGQKLKGPKTTAKAYVVGEDDTMALVAKRFGVTAKALAAANEMKVGATLREGRKLTLPDGYKDRGPIRETVAAPPRPEPPAPRPAAPPPVYTPPVTPPVATPPVATPPAATPQPTPPPPAARPTPQPYTPLPPPPAPRPTPPPATRPAPPPATRPATPIVPSSGPVADSTISSLGRGRFIWPLRGDVLSDFGPKGTGQRNDGINIRAQAGEPVRVAAGGDVVYAGDQVPGFGNLVLVKHADGWVTAYGHLGRVDVKMTQDVVQGQQIGMAGSTGGVSETQVHFEVRYAPTPQDRARPVDPKLVLPR